MPVQIRAIATAVPPVVVAQPELRDLLASQPDTDRRQRRLIAAAFDASGIDTRHSVETDFDPSSPGGGLFRDAGRTELRFPGTAARNARYHRDGPPLLAEAAASALSASQDLAAADVTHLITVSCTGFTAPGPDQFLVSALGLDRGVERYSLGFLGCHGAFAGLRAARAFCLARPDAVVLVACVELCTLHLQPPTDTDAILAASLFADGAAVAVVSARSAPPGAPVLDLDVLQTQLTGVGASDMTWTLGDSGFLMRLTGYVPRLLGAHLEKVVAPLFDADLELAGRPFATVPRWAVHPGGRSILDHVQSALQLPGGSLAASREVLRRYGNMSSATVLFVLREILRSATGPAPERVAALAFGPGLTVESALLTRRVAE